MREQFRMPLIITERLQETSQSLLLLIGFQLFVMLTRLLLSKVESLLSRVTMRLFSSNTLMVYMLDSAKSKSLLKPMQPNKNSQKTQPQERRKKMRRLSKLTQ